MHAAASACEGFGPKTTQMRFPALQSRNGFLNYCGSVAPSRAEILHWCHSEEEHELECHLNDDHFQDAFSPGRISNF